MNLSEGCRKSKGRFRCGTAHILSQIHAFRHDDCSSLNQDALSGHLAPFAASGAPLSLPDRLNLEFPELYGYVPPQIDNDNASAA